MKKQCKYIIKFINAKNEDGTVWYTLQVFNAKDDQSWSFRQRYSHMRDIHQRCMLTNKKNDLPEFPHKKIFGNTKEDFIQKRKKELENYYNTLLSSQNIDIQTDLPQLLQFFNTGKPKKQTKSSDQAQSKNTLSMNVNNPKSQQNIQEKKRKQQINKQVQLRKKFDQIIKSTQSKLVQCDDFNNQIDDQTRKKYNHQFQKLKIQYKSQLLNNIASSINGEDKLKGTKDVQDCWAFQLKDHYQNNFNKLNKIVKLVQNMENLKFQKGNNQQKPSNFVIAF